MLILPLSEFYKHKAMSDGHLNKCKSCNKIDVSKNYRKNKKHYIAYEQKRNRNPDRVKARKDYYLENKDTEEYKLRSKIFSKKYKVENKIKREAHVKWGNYVRDNKIASKPCVKCGVEKAEAHHEDYNKPLDIIWLCKDCHMARHVEINYAIKVLEEDWSDRGF